MAENRRKKPSGVASTIKRINKRHDGLLVPGEEIESAAFFVEATKPQIGAIWTGFGAIGALIGSGFAKKAVKVRVQQIMSETGITTAEAPDSKNGFALALTQSRLLIFNQNVKKLLVEIPIGSFSYQIVEHEKMYSLLLESSLHGRLIFTSVNLATKPAEHFRTTLAEQQGTASPVQPAHTSG